MKLDGERPHHNNISHELASEAVKSDGCLKVDTKTGWEGKHDILPHVEKVGEQTNPSQHSYVEVGHLINGNQDTGEQCMIHQDKTRHIVSEYNSYDKDVTEIKLLDTVVSSNYDAHFVKDVCIDEGAHSCHKILAEKVVDEKVSPNVDCSMRDMNGDLSEELADDSAKCAHEVKSKPVPEAVNCYADGDTKEQYSSGKVYDLEGEKAAAAITGDLGDEKLSLKELLVIESAPNPQNRISFESSEDCKLSLDGQTTDQVPADGCHEVKALVPETGKLIQSGSLTEAPADDSSHCIPEEHAIAGSSEMGGFKQSNHHYNPFITDGSAEATLEHEYSLFTSMASAGGESIHDVPDVESFDHFLSSTPEMPNTAEVISSGCSDAQASDKNDENRENHANKVTDNVVEGTASATSVSSDAVEPNDVNVENHAKCEIDGVDNASGFNPRDTEIGTNRSKDNTGSKKSTSVQSDSVVEEPVPDSAKMSAQTGSRNPFESSFSGPSITLGPVSSSGHIPYSGNISLRSDSSTTSTRSFAFPILQTEWNSSPVKMAKPDRRRFRRQRGWRNGLLCCKF